MKKEPIKSFITNFVINYVNKNWYDLKIGEDKYGVYTVYSQKDIDANCTSKIKFVRELKSDFCLVEWVIQEVFWFNESLVYSKTESNDESSIPIIIYDLGGVLVKSYPTKTDKPYWDVWNWEYYENENIKDDKVYNIAKEWALKNGGNIESFLAGVNWALSNLK
jgi:hypothetical protein